MNDIESRVSEMPKASRLYYNQVIKRADEDIFATTADLRTKLSEGAIEPEFRDAANLALVSMTAALSDEKPLTDADAVKDIQSRIEKAKLAGDEVALNALQGGLDTYEAKKAQTAERAAQQAEALKEQTAAFEEQKKERYEELLAENKAIEMQRIRGMSLDMAMHPERAEAYFEKHHEAAVIRSVQQATGYSPKASIEE